MTAIMKVYFYVIEFICNMAAHNQRKYLQDLIRGFEVWTLHCTPSLILQSQQDPFIPRRDFPLLSKDKATCFTGLLWAVNAVMCAYAAECSADTK